MQQHGPECHAGGCRGFGSRDMGVMFVGIAPGQDEVGSGTPFTGPSGRLLNGCLKFVGLDRDDMYCTNLICWFNNEPTQDEIKECQPRLVAELMMVRPRLIVPLGALSCNQFLGEKIGKVRGTVSWNDTLNCYIMPTYHPSAFLQGGFGLIHDIIRDLAKIPRILEWGPGCPNAKVNYEVINDRDRAQQILDGLDPTRIVALDVETNGRGQDLIDPQEDPLLCVGISQGGENETWVFHGDLVPDLSWPLDLKWTFHNGMFDTQVMRRWTGKWFPIAEDTMLMSYSLDERQGVHGLKGLQREYLGAGFYEEIYRKEGQRVKRNHLGLVPMDILAKYNAQDVCGTARLWPILYEMQVKDNVRAMYERMLRPAANMFKEVNYRGVAIDKLQMAVFGYEWGERYLKEEQALSDMAREMGWDGDAEINLDSPKQLAHLLYDILKLPGGPSTRAEVLEKIADRHPFVNRLVEMRHLAKMLSTYVIGIQTQIKRTKRCHPDTKLHGAVTGRISYSDPPLQVIPKMYTVGNDYGRLRRMFIASDDEHVIVQADLKQAELWSAASESKDPQMLKGLQSGDHHRANAAEVLGIDPSAVTAKQRYDQKFVTFGVLYGREAPSVARGINKSTYEAQRYIDGFFANNPDFYEWWMRQQSVAKEEGELVSRTGRKRRFRLVYGEDGYRAMKQAVNFPVQSVASDAVMDAAVELHEALKPYDSYVLFLVHDAIVFEVSKKHFELVMRMIHDAMSRPRFEGFTGIPVEIGWGANWLDQEDWVHTECNLYWCCGKANQERLAKQGVATA